MSKKPDYQLEYVYTKNHYKRTLWCLFGIWFVLRTLRAVLYLTLGMAFLSSIPAAFIFFFTGFVWGMAALAIYRYTKSVRVDDIEREKGRLTKK